MASHPRENSPYNLRLATLSDIPALRILIDLSVRTLHAPYYTTAQIAAALSSSIYGVDTQLILDEHYFVITSTSSSSPSEEIIASGGWSHVSNFSHSRPNHEQYKQASKPYAHNTLSLPLNPSSKTPSQKQ
jgi:hypothetical protein